MWYQKNREEGKIETNQMQNYEMNVVFKMIKMH